jgi:glycosyltransferase involved in cell wall biosynthesis
MSTIAILIPCYNEEITIGKVIDDWRKALPSSKIYVYNNASTDNTAKEAKKHNAIVRYAKKRGKGNVIKKMFQEIEADIYIMVDGDDTYSTENAQKMVELIESQKADMVICDRLSSTYYTENTRKGHNFGNKLFKNIINLLFHGNEKDILSGCRAFSKKFVKNIKIESQGFQIETELTIYALCNNYKIISLPTLYKERVKGSHSKLKTIPDGIKIFCMILKMFLKNKKNKQK